MGNPRADEASSLNSQLQHYQYGNGGYPTPLSLSRMNEITNMQLLGDRNRALSQAGSLGAARGYSLGLNNPFAYSRRAESDIYNQYAGAFSNSLGANIDRSFGQGLASAQARWARLSGLLGMRQANISNLSGGFWNDTAGPLLGAGIGAFGSIYGGKLAGDGAKAAAGLG